MKIIQKAIIKKGNNFLILLRSSQAEFFPNYWDFPGGKLEKGEEPYIGIEREVLEETNLKIKAKKVTGIYEMTLKDTLHRFVIYNTDLLSDNIKLSHEHEEFRWATKEKILNLQVEPYMLLYFKGHSINNL